MPHTLETERSVAYRVPWRVHRVSESHPLVVNAGDESVDAVRVFRLDGTTERWGRLLPGETVDLCLCGADLDDVVLTVCWLRPSTGIEYAWRFVM